MKNRLFLLLLSGTILFVTACHLMKKPAIGITRPAIPENEEISIVITEIDTSSVELYYLIRFYYKKQNNKGIIINEKSNEGHFKIGQKKTLKLCDVIQYSSIFREVDTISIGNVPLVYGEQNKVYGRDGVVRDRTLRNGIDTICIRGDIMWNLKIITDDKLILDFGDDAIEPVYQLCDN